MSEFVEVDWPKADVSVFGVKASVHGRGWSLLRPGNFTEVVEEKVAQQVVSFLNRHATLPHGAVLHMDAGKAALLAVQDEGFCAVLLGGYKVLIVAQLRIDQVTFQEGRAVFQLPVTVHDVESLLEVRTRHGRMLSPLS